MAERAAVFEAEAAREHQAGASAKRVAYTRRLAALYTLAAAALGAPARAEPEPDIEDMLG